MAPTKCPRHSVPSRNIPSPPTRQTRARSRLPSSPALMRGLDAMARPVDALPLDPEPIPYDEVLARLTERRRTRVILRTNSTKSITPSPRRRVKIILRTKRTELTAPNQVTSIADSGSIIAVPPTTDLGISGATEKLSSQGKKRARHEAESEEPGRASKRCRSIKPVPCEDFVQTNSRETPRKRKESEDDTAMQMEYRWNPGPPFDWDVFKSSHDDDSKIENLTFEESESVASGASSAGQGLSRLIINTEGKSYPSHELLAGKQSLFNLLPTNSSPRDPASESSSSGYASSANSLSKTDTANGDWPRHPDLDRDNHKAGTGCRVHGCYPGSGCLNCANGQNLKPCHAAWRAQWDYYFAQVAELCDAANNPDKYSVPGGYDIRMGYMGMLMEDELWRRLQHDGLPPKPAPDGALPSSFL